MDDFFKIIVDLMHGLDEFKPVLPEIPEGYELVQRSPYHNVVLPKPVMPADALELAHFANHVRAIRFGRKTQTFGRDDLPSIRMLTNPEMKRWANHDWILGEFDCGTSTVAVLKPEVIEAMPNIADDGIRIFADDDRALVAKSVLLHELVHWLQYRETNGQFAPWGENFDTIMSMEREAWTVQALWLNEHGQHTSQFARLNDIEQTIERIYGASTRLWLQRRDLDRALGD